MVYEGVATVEMDLLQHKLATESPTQWGSRKWLLEQEKAITQVFAADRSTRLLSLNLLMHSLLKTSPHPMRKACS